MTSVLIQGAVVVERWSIETLMVGRLEDGALLGSQLAEDVLGPIGQVVLGVGHVARRKP